MAATGLQGIDRPDQAPMFGGGLSQPLLALFTPGTQEGQKLPVQLARVTFVDQDPSPIELPLDLNQLFVFVLMLPANECQHIQAISAVRQADEKRLTGVVMFSRVRAGRVRTLPGLTRYVHGPLHGLYSFTHVPGVAWFQKHTTVGTVL